MEVQPFLAVPKLSVSLRLLLASVLSECGFVRLRLPGLEMGELGVLTPGLVWTDARVVIL